MQATTHNRTKSAYIQHILEMDHSHGPLKDSLKILYIYIMEITYSKVVHQARHQDILIRRAQALT